MGKVLVVFALSLSALSCQPEKPSSWRPTSPDVATAEDRRAIAGAVRDLQDFADGQGRPLDFNAIEIRVVETFSSAFADSEISGVCYPGARSFIEIRKSVFDDPEEAWNIVVHELGHCVLGRPHDDALMSADGLRAVLRRGASLYDAGGLTVSVMSARGNRMAPRAYYLRELFGLERIRSLKELARRYPRSVIVE